MKVVTILRSPCISSYIWTGFGGKYYFLYVQNFFVLNINFKPNVPFMIHKEISKFADPFSVYFERKNFKTNSFLGWIEIQHFMYYWS